MLREMKDCGKRLRRRRLIRKQGALVLVPKRLLLIKAPRAKRLWRL